MTEDFKPYSGFTTTEEKNKIKCTPTMEDRLGFETSKYTNSLGHVMTQRTLKVTKKEYAEIWELGHECQKSGDGFILNSKWGITSCPISSNFNESMWKEGLKNILGDYVPSSGDGYNLVVVDKIDIK